MCEHFGVAIAIHTSIFVDLAVPGSGAKHQDFVARLLRLRLWPRLPPGCWPPLDLSSLGAQSFPKESSQRLQPRGRGLSWHYSSLGHNTGHKTRPTQDHKRQVFQLTQDLANHIKPHIMLKWPSFQSFPGRLDVLNSIFIFKWRWTIRCHLGSFRLELSFAQILFLCNFKVQDFVIWNGLLLHVLSSLAPLAALPKGLEFSSMKFE